MTKRFQWVYIKDNTLELRDNGIVNVFNNERLEELLNELHNENQELKTENKELKRKALDMEMDRDYYRTKSASLEEGYLQLQRENDRLLKENEQLKQHNTELINKIDFLERVIDGDVE